MECQTKVLAIVIKLLFSSNLSCNNYGLQLEYIGSWKSTCVPCKLIDTSILIWSLWCAGNIGECWQCKLDNNKADNSFICESLNKGTACF